MKKIVAMLLACVMVIGLLTACGSTSDKPAEQPAETPAETPDAE